MARHIENLQIETYRGIKNLQIENLGNVNIFVGENNTGKTSVLEALQLLCTPDEYNLIRIARQRERYRASIKMGLGLLDSVLFLFDVNSDYKERNEYKIHIGGTIHGMFGETIVRGEVASQFIDLNAVAQYSAVARNRLSHSIVEGQEETPTFYGELYSSFMSDRKYNQLENNPVCLEINDFTKTFRANSRKNILDVKAVQTIDHIVENAFDRLIKSKEIKDRAVDLLKEFDGTIADIRYINDENRFVPVIESNFGEYIPLSLYGDGMKKALTMLNAMVNTENGVVLIDEFETALHTSVMSKVFKFVLDIAAQLDIQMFLTTHSIEAVDKLLESAGEHIEKVRVIRLKKREEATYAKVLNGDIALNDRREYNMELRI